MRKICLLIASSFFLQSCASTLTMTPVPKEDQREVYKTGVGALISEKKNAVVTMHPARGMYESNERPEMVVSIYNRSSQQFDVSPENISISVNGEPTSVLTHAELVSEIKREKAIAVFAASLSAAADGMNAANNGYSYHQSTMPGYGTYYSQTYNPSAARRAQAESQARTEANFTSINEKAERSLNRVNNTILRRTTVMPSSWEGGHIVFSKLKQPKETHEVSFSVNVAGEKHEFLFTQSEIGK